MTSSIEKEILKDVLNNPGDTFYESVLSDFLDEQGIEHDFRKPLHNNKIAEIKPYHEKYFNIWANHWIDIGLCTKPTDEDKAEQYFSDFYKQLGFSKLKSIVWFNNTVEMFNQANSQINKKNQVWNKICGQVWNQISTQVSSQVWNQVRDQVWKQIRHNIKNIRDQLFYGQQDANWLAYYAYMMQVLRMEFPKPTVPFMLLAQEINWWFSTEETIFATRKPKECIIKDEELVKVVYQDSYTIT
jgi:hypothetical protein